MHDLKCRPCRGEQGAEIGQAGYETGSPKKSFDAAIGSAMGDLDIVLDKMIAQSGLMGIVSQSTDSMKNIRKLVKMDANGKTNFRAILDYINYKDAKQDNRALISTWLGKTQAERLIKTLENNDKLEIQIYDAGDAAAAAGRAR